jgi:hypothetical protein
MKRTVAFALLFAATTAVAQVPVTRVADDAKVLDRVAEAARKDLPRDLLRRIADEDVELLRGRRGDGTYQYAGYERLEAGRITDSFSVEPRNGDELKRLEIRGANVYRVTISLPSRRMLVTKNRRIWIDRVDIEYIPQGGSVSKTQTLKVGAWFEAGSTRNVELDDIARQATVRVYARGDKAAGYGNIGISLIQARIFDHPDSPYADAVASLKAVQRALDHDDTASIRSMAARVSQSLRGASVADLQPVPRVVDVIAPRADVAPSPDVTLELQDIEDLLTGTDGEKRQGLDRLHQLLRRLRAPK